MRARRLSGQRPGPTSASRALGVSISSFTRVGIQRNALPGGLHRPKVGVMGAPQALSHEPPASCAHGHDLTEVRAPWANAQIAARVPGFDGVIFHTDDGARCVATLPAGCLVFNLQKAHRSPAMHANPHKQKIVQHPAAAIPAIVESAYRHGPDRHVADRVSYPDHPAPVLALPLYSANGLARRHLGAVAKKSTPTAPPPFDWARREPEGPVSGSLTEDAVTEPPLRAIRVTAERARGTIVRARLPNVDLIPNS